MIYQYLMCQEKTSADVVTDLQGIDGIPGHVADFATSEGFLNEFDYLKHYYTLHVVYAPPRDDENRVRDNVMKISWLERAARTKLGVSSLRPVFFPGPWPYGIDLPLITVSKHGGTHIRLVAPADLEVG